ncbi:MAG TPA: transcriptional regulator, partial [Ramlibacter sp.]|nr:transcriptional regulator [Ramlibacter sp.]
AVVTDRAGPVLAGLGLSLDTLPMPTRGARPPCRPCLDWGERRMHLAGRLGALLCTHSLESGWLLRQRQSRTLTLTPEGARAWRDWLGVARWQALA